jgi:hypothetical protein
MHATEPDCGERALMCTPTEVLRMNFDRVELDHPDGRMRLLNLAEFNALGAIDKVQWISQGRFRFFRSGVKVPASEALKR